MILHEKLFQFWKKNEIGCILLKGYIHSRILLTLKFKVRILFPSKEQ